LEAVSLGVRDGVSLAVGVGVSVGKGVNVCVAVGGANVGETVAEAGVGGTVADGGRVRPIVGVAGVNVAVADAVAVAWPGALRMATQPAQ
jgi:hypothetical protein